MKKFVSQDSLGRNRWSSPKIIARAGFFVILSLLLPVTLNAHEVISDLENMSGSEALIFYLALGFRHIIPLGLDHILFVVSLFLLSPKLKPLMWQSFTFTIAHSITLGLAMFDIIKAPAALIEPLIALSIVYVALENIFASRLQPSRIAIVFLFGLIHGLGFAGALGELGLPSNAYAISLVMFNIGVELGQLTVILIAFLLLGKWFSQRPWYRRRIVIPMSLIIAAVAVYWVVERTLF